MEANQKFKGFMKKKTEDVKKHYWMLPNVAALCTQKEIDDFRKTSKNGKEVPEEVTIYTFIMDVCQRVEIVNNNGDNCFAYYPMLPKVYYLTQKSVKSFRSECRIE